MLKGSSFHAKKAAQLEQLFGVRNLSLIALKVLIKIYINIDIKLIFNRGFSPHRCNSLYQWCAGLLCRVDPVDIRPMCQSISHDGEVLQGRWAVEQRARVKAAEVLVCLVHIWVQQTVKWQSSEDSVCVSVCVCTHLSENLCSSGRHHWDSVLREDKNRITVFLCSLQIIARQISWTLPSPVTRGNVALLGLGLSGGRCAVLSCVAVLFLLALDRRSRVFLPVSGSLWMNFFSTYFERIQDSLSPLRHRRYSMYLNNWKSSFL